MSDLTIDVELDTRGLNCPLPILKAKKSLASMTSGQLLRVVATDTGSMRDFQAFCQRNKLRNVLNNLNHTAVFFQNNTVL